MSLAVGQIQHTAGPLDLTPPRGQRLASAHVGAQAELCLARQLAVGEEIHVHREALALKGDVTLEGDAAQLMARITGGFGETEVGKRHRDLVEPRVAGTAPTARLLTRLLFLLLVCDQTNDDDRHHDRDRHVPVLDRQPDRDHHEQSGPAAAAALFVLDHDPYRLLL
ncbi:MAG: hypothetical protein ACTHQQ_10130 [Solirubrobacteraceae bacterium]